MVEEVGQRRFHGPHCLAVPRGAAGHRGTRRIDRGVPGDYRHPVPTGPDPASLPARTCTTPDGVDLAVYDFGGTGPDLLLVHATGFCAGVLLPLARALSDRFRCHALDLRGHGRSGRPADGDFAWSGFATDVLTVVDRLGLDRPAGFGHSCGGASLLLAEQARHGTFRSLYLFEPVVVPDQPVPFPLEENPLSRGARRRRADVPLRRGRLRQLRRQAALRRPRPRGAARYVEDGFEVVPADEGGDGRTVRLRCRREDEAAGLRPRLRQRRLRPPRRGRLPDGVRLRRGAPTPSAPRSWRADAARVPRATVESFPGTRPLRPPRAARRGGRGGGRGARRP